MGLDIGALGGHEQGVEHAYASWTGRRAGAAIGRDLVPARLRRVLGLVLASAALLHGACTELDLDSLRFACRADEDCARGLVCDPRVGLCVAPTAVSDAGAVDAAPPLAQDASVSQAIDSGCSPALDETTRDTTHWWCRGLSGTELRRITDRLGARVLDIEVEPAGTYSVALARKADALRTEWADDVPTSAVESSYGDRGLALIDYTLRPGGLLLGVFDDSPGAWFWGNAAADALPDALKRGPYSRSWIPPTYGLRVISLDHITSDGEDRYAWVLKVRGGDRGSRVEFDLTPAEVAERAASDKLVSIEGVTLDRFAVSTATRATTDLPARFLHAVTIEALDAALSADRAHVRSLIPHETPEGPRWSALLVRTASTPRERIAERMGDMTVGDALMLLVSTRGATITRSRQDQVVRSGGAISLYLLLGALERVQRGEVSLDTRIPYFAYAANSCPSTRSSSTTTLREAMEGVARDPTRYDLGYSLRVFQSTRRLLSTLAAVGTRQTRLVGTPGCATDVSTTSLDDLVRGLRALDTRLDDRHRALAHAMLWGTHVPPPADVPWDLTLALRELATEEALRREIPATRRQAFLARLSARYLRANAGEFTDDDQLLVGQVELPTCRGGQSGSETWRWGLGVAGAQSYRDAIRAVAVSRVELLRAPLGDALEALECDP